MGEASRGNQPGNQPGRVAFAALPAFASFRRGKRSAKGSMPLLAELETMLAGGAATPPQFPHFTYPPPHSLPVPCLAGINVGYLLVGISGQDWVVPKAHGLNTTKR